IVVIPFGLVKGKMNGRSPPLTRPHSITFC
ncbi:hypothetical protein KKC1_25470, partial [Calderihabitans maritimus]